MIEIISPSNKTDLVEIAHYQKQRSQVFLGQGVRVVEIDATRSVKRLIQHELTCNHPYHAAIFIPDENIWILENQFEERLQRVALPLRSEAVPIEPQDAYDNAYRRLAIAGHLERSGHYIEEALPFPTLITGTQRETALEAIEKWRNELKQLGD